MCVSVYIYIYMIKEQAKELLVNSMGGCKSQLLHFQTFKLKMPNIPLEFKGVQGVWED